MHALFDETTPWFWIFVGVGTVFVGLVFRWLWHAILLSMREALREPVAEAQQTAQLAAEHAAELKDAVGIPNGGGNLVTMIERALTQQDVMLKQLVNNQAEAMQWRLDHDEKDDLTRASVRRIETHLGLNGT